jgi:D-glycero-D-manno-heptose 1,7-bisphosphate phosphatase
MTLYIFDKDGTLIELKKNRLLLGRPVLRPDEQKPKPGVVEKLAELRSQGHTLAIASNQRAISQGLITAAQAEKLIEDAIQKVGGVDAWRICPFDEHARKTIHGQPNPYKLENDCKKPKPGMLVDLMQALGFKPEDTVMVGDSWRDRKAAQSAGVSFVPAKEFFKATNEQKDGSTTGQSIEQS